MFMNIINITMYFPFLQSNFVHTANKCCTIYSSVSSFSGTIFLSKNPGSGSGEDNVQSIDMEEAGNDGFDNPACSVVEAEEGV